MTTVKIKQLFSGTLVREGAGVKLMRYLGADNTNPVEPILLFDYFNSTDYLDYIGGFPPHPHRGFETVTYLLHGSIHHEDTKGNKGIIGPGDVQWMTAGKGIIHSEMPSAEQGRLQGLQLWLNLPAALKMSEPKYQQMNSEAIAIENKAAGVQVKVIAGTTNMGTTGTLAGITTAPLFLDILLDKEKTFVQDIPSHYQAILFVLSGQIIINGQQVDAEQLAALDAGERIELIASGESQCLLIAAAKLNEPIVRRGPFVMNTQEEIRQAIVDFHGGEF